MLPYRPQFPQDTLIPAKVPGRATGARPGRGRTAVRSADPVLSRDIGANFGLVTDNLRVALALLLIMTVSRVHQQFAVLVALRVGLLLTFAVGVFAWLHPKALRKDRVFSKWPAKLMLGIGAIACASVPFGLSIGASGKELLQGFSKVLIGAFLLIAASRGVNDLYTLLVGAVTGFLVMAFLALFVFPVAPVGADFSRISGGLGFDANDLATMAVVGIALSFALLMGTKGRVRWLGAATIAGLLACLTRTGSRGGFLGLLALGLGFLFLVSQVKPWKRILLVGSATLALTLFSPSGYWTQMKTILNPKDDYNWTEPTGRKQVWKRGIDYMIRYPITGIGIGNFARAEGTISKRAADFVEGMPGVRWSAAHNSFVQAGAEMGVPGLLVFTALVLGGIIANYRIRKRLPIRTNSPPQVRFLSFLATGLSLGFIGFAVSGFFVSFAYWDIVYILAAFTSVLQIFVEDLTPPAPIRPRRSV